MARRLSTKQNPFAISCHYAPEGRPLCGNSPDMHDTGNPAEFAQHPGACGACRGRIAGLHAVELAAKGLDNVGFPVSGVAIRALRRGNVAAIQEAAAEQVACVERVAGQQAWQGKMPSWYPEAKAAAAAFLTAASALSVFAV